MEQVQMLSFSSIYKLDLDSSILSIAAAIMLRDSDIDKG